MLGRIGDNTSGSSSSQSSDASGKGKQLFEAAVEQMCSELQNGGMSATSKTSVPFLDADHLHTTEPGAGTARPSGPALVSDPAAGAAMAIHPPSPSVATPSPKNKMKSLRRELRDAVNASWEYHNKEDGIKMFDRVVKAGAEVLEYYAELAALDPDGARNILSNSDALKARKQVLEYGRKCCDDSCDQIDQLYADRVSKSDWFEKLRFKVSPDQLSNMASSAAKGNKACLEWLETWALRKEQMRIVCAATVNLCPDGPAALRMHTGSAFVAKVGRLEGRVTAAQFELSQLAGTCEAVGSELFTSENQGMRQLQRSMWDVYSAVGSTGPLNREDRLEQKCLDVLGEASERLLEIGSALHSMIIRLSGQRIGTGLPLSLLKQIEQEAWDTAHHAAGFLAMQPPPAIIAPPADSWAAIPAAGAAGRSKRKGKNQLLGGAVHSPMPPEPQVAPAASETGPAAMVVVRSDLGTKTLVSAKAADAMVSAAARQLEMWRPPTSRAELKPLLERLDELLKFDVAGQQSAASKARYMKPEDAKHLVETTIKRLQEQAKEMDAPLNVLEDHHLRLLLTPARMGEVHKKIVALGYVRANVNGLAERLDRDMADMLMDCRKSYHLPTQNYLEHLRKANELRVHPPQPLKGGDGRLFSIKIEPKPLMSGRVPAPLWVHIHTRRQTEAGQLPTLHDNEFTACHVKNNEQHGHNQQWLDARAEEGCDKFVIHRGKLSTAFCKALLNGMT
ncbi:hypothetical protein QCM77_43135 [Bradyrhizobium sp. SSUT18]|uniref:hypothetical protein n=1 Tax=Bradyrhizobium sp. SSUT18 TaxID=3040602 RepID=UPI002448B0A4|nr:hypothetical protein [Bradyrhizobium sp. SSUT18]MDH2406600.1 hypothetical protein [Bradyrhizobium sp. SSUT18]